jgi:tRNA threonylcarbamoyladenosine biosynthesis protein TsaB
VNVLALDTSTLQAVLALEISGGVRAGRLPDPDLRHGRSLVPTIHALLSEAGLKVVDLDAIAVGLGPGSYTGLRIGIIAARVLGYAAQRPVYGLDSPALYARHAQPGSGHIAVISDAQRGELYLAQYLASTPGKPPTCLHPSRIVNPSELESLPPGTTLAGPALERIGAVWPAHLARLDSSANRPSPDALLDLAHAAISTGPAPDPSDLLPSYLRRSAAEDRWVERRARDSNSGDPPMHPDPHPSRLR